MEGKHPNWLAKTVETATDGRSAPGHRSQHDHETRPEVGDGPADILLDLRGLKCPMPVLRTRKALAGLDVGACLRVACTDALAAIDIPHLLRESGDALIETRRDGDVIVFRIQKR